jgi:hypothetical protein
MIKSIALSMLTVMALCGSNAAARDSKKAKSKKIQDSILGLGVVLGEPTGISLKKWVGDIIAINGAAAWSFGRKDAFQIHADFLFHKFGLFEVGEGKLPLYYGIGTRVKFETDSKVGARIPVGVNYIFENEPLDIFLEIVPILDLAPSTKFDLNGAIGIRFFFW